MNLDVTYILLLLKKKIKKNKTRLNKKVSQILKKFSSLYTVFSGIEVISWDESSRLLYDISNTFFIVPCLANLSDISFQ